MMIELLAALSLVASAPSDSLEAGKPAGTAEVSVTDSIRPDGARVLVHEVTIAAPVEAVWHAVSTAQGWMTWAAPIAWQNGDILETSYTPTASPGDATTIRQQILEREPGRRFAFRTVKAPEGFPHFDTYRLIDVAIDLEPVGDGTTRVRLTSAGYPETEAGCELERFFREGNRTSLEQLRLRFAAGPADWGQRP